MRFISKILVVTMGAMVSCVTWANSTAFNTSSSAQSHYYTGSESSTAGASQMQSNTVVNSKALQLASQNGVYLGFDVGRLWADWSVDSVDHANFSENHGFSFDLDMGYQWNQYLAGEVGYIYIPDAFDVSSYALYTAGKAMVDLPYRMDLFAKFGFAYHHVSYNGDASYVNPLFAVGLGYNYIKNISFDLQYLYLSGDDDLNKLYIAHVPDSQMLMFGISYNISM